MGKIVHRRAGFCMRHCIVRLVPPIHNHFIDKLAVLNGFISGIALYPYIFDILVRGAENNLSTLTLVLIFTNNIVWFLYSLHRLLASLIIAAMLNLIAAGILLLL